MSPAVLFVEREGLRVACARLEAEARAIADRYRKAKTS